MTSALPVRTVEPDLVHDSLLTGIQGAEGKDLLLFFTSEDGQDFTLRLQGVEQFLCNEFREGNIVFDIVIESKDRFDRNALRKLLELGKNRSSSALESYAERLSEGEIILLTVTCSYGCEILCVCRGFHLERTPTRAVSQECPLMQDRPVASFDELLDAALEEWPDQIDVREGTLFDEGAGNFPALTAVKDRLEERFIAAGRDDLMDMNWAIFTSFHKSAMASTVVDKSLLRRQLVQYFFERNRR